MADDHTLSRRAFARLLTSVSALPLAGQVGAAVDTEGGTADASYRYVQSATPDGYAVPTLLRVRSPAAFESVRHVAGDPVTTTEPRPAAFAHLTAAQASVLAHTMFANALGFEQVREVDGEEVLRN